MDPFPDLRAGGRALAPRVEHFKDRDGLVILALVSAGVPVAAEVAHHLNAPLDFVIIRRLLQPRGPGSQLCAVNVAGTLVLDDELPPIPAEPQSPVDHFLAASIAELQQRASVCRGERLPFELNGKTVMLVDCGIRSSLTMQAAIKTLRTLRPRRIVVAVPVTSASGAAVIRELADEFVWCDSPEPFGNVGLWYKDFSRPADDRLGEFIRETRSNAA